jgi:hypothetical protein
MANVNKGRLEKMKTVFNKVEEGEDSSSSEKITFEKEEIKYKELNNKTSKVIDKSYKFRNTVETVEIASFKVFNIDIEDKTDKTKCSQCVSQCIIF